MLGRLKQCSCRVHTNLLAIYLCLTCLHNTWHRFVHFEMDDPVPRHGTAHRYDDAKSEWRSLHLAVDLWVINGGDDDCGHTLRRFCAQYMDTHLAVGGDLCLAVAAVATTLALQHMGSCCCKCGSAAICACIL